MQCTYFDKTVVEVQPDEASGDTTVVLDGSSHCLLHQVLCCWAALAVEPNLQAGAFSGNGEKGKDGYCRGEDQALHG
jgi:hypothetical protein